MYVSVDSPLPQNGSMPPPAGCVNASNAVIELARQVSQYGRLVTYGSVPTLASFAEISPGAAVSAAVMLPASLLARSSVLSGAVPAPGSSTLTVQPAAVRRLVVVPLNWIPDVEGGSSCSPRASAVPLSVPAVPAVVMPVAYGQPPAPLPPAALPAPLAAARPAAVGPATARPAYANLCWALRNGMVDADQFNPSELAALQLRCSQLGYAGSCPPPAAVSAWKTQQRAAGGLPHISVAQSDLDALPPAPPLTGVNCVASWKLGGAPAGLSGLVPWGDTPLVGPAVDASAAASPLASWLQSNPWAIWAAVGVGALALFGGRR
jgi:hypothetical protein